MDVFKLMGSLDIPDTNEETLSKFITDNQVEINKLILQLWEDYNKKINVNSEDNNSQFQSNNNTQESNDVASEIVSDETTSKDPIQESTNEDIAVTDSKSSTHLGKDFNKNNTNDFALQIKNKNIIIPNGKVNQEYRFKLNIEAIGLADIGDFWFEGIENVGLSFDHDLNELYGMPILAGDHKIKLRIKRKDWAEGKPIFDRMINLIINPDPKSLWKNIPTPTDIEYYKPDSDKCFVKVESSSKLFGLGKNPKKDIVAASQRGRSHAQEGKPRDDDFRVTYIKDLDWYVLSVADGAGAYSSSRKGSEIACKTVVSVCEQLIKERAKEFEIQIKDFSAEKSDEKRKKVGDSLYGIIGNAVFKSMKNIEEEAKLSNKAIKEFSTTLIVAICKKFKFGWFVGAFWVGDGGIGIYNSYSQFLKVLGEPDGGEYAGQTRFLTMPEITQPAELYRRLRFEIVEDFTSLILMTDGITDPKFETESNLLKIEKWNKLWEDLSSTVDFSDDNESSADQLLEWLDFWSPGNHDDRTLAILF